MSTAHSNPAIRVLYLVIAKSIYGSIRNSHDTVPARATPYIPVQYQPAYQDAYPYTEGDGGKAYAYEYRTDTYIIIAHPVATDI